MALILIVDDEIENLKALKRALNDENPGWIILTAQGEKTGIQVLEQQIKNKEPIDVVLSDLVMEEERSGMNILQKARELDPLVMTILFTAKEQILDRYAAFDIGAFDVVEKNIRGIAAVREINIKTRQALRYREWSQRILLMRRYFDPKVFKVIEKDPSLLEVSRRTLTIVFWDIRGFSRLCENLKAHPDLVSGFLREYFEAASQVIFDHDGVVDKFIGDGIMALFGVINHKEDQGKTDAVSAVKAAFRLRSKFDELVKQWKEQWGLYVPDKIEIGLGCGIHTGDVLVGNIGTDFRDQFTALGANVNFASRIESRSGDGQILLSQTTEQRVKKSFKVSKHDEIDNIKNIPGKFTLYRIDSE